MNKKIIAAWIAAAAACAAGIAVFLMMKGMQINQPAAAIYLDGKLYRTLSLEEDTQLEIASSYGSNTVKVEAGAISVVSADCPDKVCVRSGAISGGAIPIICLPHRLEIRIISTAEDEVDAQIN